MKTGQIIGGLLIATGIGAVIYFGFVKKFEDGLTGFQKLTGKKNEDESQKKEENPKTSATNTMDSTNNPNADLGLITNPPPKPTIKGKNGFNSGDYVYIKPTLTSGIKVYNYPKADSKFLVRTVAIQSAPIGKYLGDATTSGWIEALMGVSKVYIPAYTVTNKKP